MQVTFNNAAEVPMYPRRNDLSGPLTVMNGLRGKLP